MFTLRKKFKFEAAHQLPNHDGKCANLHGHSWIGWVEVSGSEIAQEGPKEGMLMDYSDIKATLEPLVEEFLDHHHLNETLPLDAPTSEAVARWMYDKLEKNLGHALVAVEIEETCTSSCRYEKTGINPWNGPAR